MFVVYNSILRRHPEQIFSTFSSAGNLFSTTIFVLVSAVQKISTRMRLPPGTKLYRFAPMHLAHVLAMPVMLLARIYTLLSEAWVADLSCPNPSYVLTSVAALDSQSSFLCAFHTKLLSRLPSHAATGGGSYRPLRMLMLPSNTAASRATSHYPPSWL